jgi:hypothetical protein
MRRILPLLVVAACPLAAAGCDRGPSATSSTVAVDTLSGTLSGTSAPASSTTAPDTPAPDTTMPDTSGPPTTAGPPIVLADELADLVEGRPAVAPQSDTIVDDTGRLRLAVPRSWSDRRTTPSPLREGEEAPYIAAALDQTRFFDGYGEPGLTAVVVDSPPDDALDAYRFDDCTPEGRHQYRGPRLAGEYEVWRDCGETGSAIVTVAVRQGRTPGTVLLLAQIVEPADLAALDHALATLRLGP